MWKFPSNGRILLGFVLAVVLPLLLIGFLLGHFL